MNFGTQRQGTGDADALPLSSGKFVGITRARRLVEPDGAQEFGDAVSEIEILSSPMNDQWFSNDVFHAVARIERGEWILKDDLQVAAPAPHLASPGRQQIAAFEFDCARSRLDQAKDEASQGTLAGTGLAYQAKRLSSVNIQRNIVYRANSRPRFPPEYRLGLREDLGQVADLKQWHCRQVRSIIC